MTIDHTVISNTALSCENSTCPDTLSNGTTIEGLEILDVIGVGGFGIVYKAWDPMLERLVALKEYLPASLAIRKPNGQVRVRKECDSGTYDAGLRSFINEARLLAQFDHAALVKVYRFWEMSGTAYMVMPLYQGETLKQHEAKNSKLLQEDTLLDWLVTLTEALEVMHTQKCYHRDISPENILILEESGRPVLLDFGAARKVIGKVSRPFTVILKASYAPIEQYAELASMPQGPWTDVYALAAVAHFLITGKTPPSSISRLVNDSYIPLATQDNLPFNTIIKQAIDRALAVQPEDRTPSMVQLRTELLTRPSLQYASTTKTTHSPKQLEFTKSPNRIFARVDTRIFKVLIGMVLLGLVLSMFWPATPANERVVGTIETDTKIQETKQTEFEDFVSPLFRSFLEKVEYPLSVRMDNTVLKINEDLLNFQVESPFQGFVAVYVLSSDQSLLQLLPNERILAVPIEAHMWTTLPPANEPIQAAGPAGINQFLVVVTERLRSYDHLNMQNQDGFGLIQSKHIQLEGISTCSTESCQDRVAATWFSVDEVD